MAVAACIAALVSCKGHLDIDPVTPGGGSGTDTETAVDPAPCSNKIVAHRGGSSECGSPDNSIAALKYAMSLKLYGSECDIYWTKDNDVIVAHADDKYKVNGLLPWESTVTEIRLAGRLKNGEQIPTLSDFLSTVMVKDNCTKLILDIKYTSPNSYASKAVSRACEIIKEKNATKFCEFICTGNESVAITAANCQTAYGIPVGWMANQAPSYVKSKGFTWANLSCKSYMTPYGVRSIDEFVNADMEISVFNVDKAGSSDSNAVTSDSDVKYYLDNYSKLRFITTNYPKWLLSKI